MPHGLTAQENLRLKEVNVRILEMSFKIADRENVYRTPEESVKTIKWIFNELVRVDINPLCGLF